MNLEIFEEAFENKGNRRGQKREREEIGRQEVPAYSGYARRYLFVRIGYLEE